MCYDEIYVKYMKSGGKGCGKSMRSPNGKMERTSPEIEVSGALPLPSLYSHPMDVFSRLLCGAPAGVLHLKPQQTVGALRLDCRV